MNRTIAMVATSAALVGCGAGIRSVDQAAAATSGPTCLAGTWEIDAVGDVNNLQSAGDLDDVTITFGDGVWSLAADDGTFTGIVDGAIVDAELDGTASGTYTRDGDTITLAIESADGESESSLQPVEFADVVAAALPSDPFHVTCNDTDAELLSDVNTAIVLTDHQPSSSEATPASTPSAAGDCLVGEWNLDSIDTSLGGATVTGVTLTFDGSAWTWTATEATLSGSLAGTEIEGSFDGLASGAYAWDGDSMAVTTESAEGTVSAEFGEDTTFEELLQTLVPSAILTVVCDNESATLTAGVAALSLTRLSEPTASAPPATETAASPASPGEALEINSAGITSEYDCEGRDVDINASAVTVELNGDCPAITINGTGNDVIIERVDVIVVNGTGNDVLWESAITTDEPAVTTDGPGNQVDRA